MVGSRICRDESKVNLLGSGVRFGSELDAVCSIPILTGAFSAKLATPFCSIEDNVFKNSLSPQFSVCSVVKLR